ncbi:hypothetical protein H7A76_27860 [Pseudomonas sp. MSSRFD41]|uniref:hypothetical protein n=1 Tax=Pseudomonas sp. MSSRFD41 TaxID=1310370 RepID=UPI00163A81DF|nr:hypothetical protein [Pseudomonas sp. MSSRFD41]MBC2659273.1 hypothetical protein [Pseudomonas sp. MSSRFD41]
MGFKGKPTPLDEPLCLVARDILLGKAKAKVEPSFKEMTVDMQTCLPGCRFKQKMQFDLNTPSVGLNTPGHLHFCDPKTSVLLKVEGIAHYVSDEHNHDGCMADQAPHVKREDERAGTMYYAINLEIANQNGL